MSKRGLEYSLRVHPAGLALMLPALFFGSSNIALSAALALLLHEGAHMLAMALCGVKRCSVELTPFGGIADAAGYEALSPARQAISALSGVAVSLAAGLLCLRLAPVTLFWHAMWRVNLSLALVNCLPVWPLDGARAVMALASLLGFAPTALRVMRGLAYALSLALTVLGLYSAFTGSVNLSLLLAAPYLGYAAREGALSEGVRLMRRVEASRGRLMGGGTLPVRALVSMGKPDLLHMTKAIKHMPWGEYCIMLLTSAEGKITHTLTEKQIIDELFDRGAGSTIE